MITRSFLIAVVLFGLLNIQVKGQTPVPKLFLIADTLERNGDYNNAAPRFLILMNEALADTIRGEVLMSYGFCKRGLGQFDSAIFFLQKANDIWGKTNNVNRLYKSHLNMGRIYNITKNYTEAEVSFDNALHFAQSSKDSLKILIDKCILEISQEHYEVAYRIIKNRIAGFPKNTLPDQAYYISLGQGMYFVSKKMYDSALFYLKNATNENASGVSFKSNLYRNIADAYVEMGNYPKAFVYMDTTTIITGNESADENLLLDYDTYRNLYEKTGNYEKALVYAKKRQEISDKLYSTETNKALQDVKIKYETQKTLDDNKLLEKDKTISQRNFLLSVIALGLVGLLAFGAFRNTRIKQKANQLLTLQKQQVQQLADQLAVANDTKARLFSTIGHDLRSPVSSLYASLKMQELKGNTAGDGMSEQTVRLLDTLEELLIWSKSQMDGFTVQPVKVNVRYFFEDLKEFYSTAATARNVTIINEAAPETIIRTDENLLKTIFRNAISNAITNTADGTTIQLTAQPTDNSTICMSVINPCDEAPFQKFKMNFDEAVVKSGAYGLGIILIKEFAQKLGAGINLTYTGGRANLSLCVPHVQVK